MAEPTLYRGDLLCVTASWCIVQFHTSAQLQRTTHMDLWAHTDSITNVKAPMPRVFMYYLIVTV